jgi:hypothetical protein
MERRRGLSLKFNSDLMRGEEAAQILERAIESNRVNQ